VVEVVFVEILGLGNVLILVAVWGEPFACVSYLHVDYVLYQSSFVSFADAIVRACQWRGYRKIGYCHAPDLALRGFTHMTYPSIPWGLNALLIFLLLKDFLSPSS